ncbi:MAG: polyisoprenoid-binding protein [Gammaproteobacteria bacterium]|nr:polyisoprenoid-binding protein [Gammaproteobacteria bacterium]
MKKWIAAAMLGAASMTAFASSENYTIDPLHTFPNFKIDHMGFSTMYGRFGTTSGKLVFDRDTMSGSVEISIDAASVNTGFQKRDDHLRSPDFLNVAEFPTITFSAKDAKLNKDGTGTIKGQLTMAGVTRPVGLIVNRSRCDMNPVSKKFACGFDATTRIKRSDFGVKYAIPGIGDDMDLMLEIEAARD